MAWRPDTLGLSTATPARLTRPRIRFRPRLAASAVVFAVAFAGYLAVAAILVLGHETIVGDAFSRVGNAYYVLFSRDPHLAAIGFVWNPLPALATLPLLPFSEIWPPLVRSGFAGNIVSALFMAAATRQVWCWCRDLGLGTPSTAGVTVLFAAHPLIVLYGANGMSEASFVFFLIFSARQIARWVQTQGVGELVWAGAGLAFAYMTRYEAVAAAGAALTFVTAFTFIRGRGGIRQRAPMAMADAIVMGLPFAAAFGAWSLASLIIVGSPFETFTSVYGNSNQIALSIESVRRATGETPTAALGYAARQMIGLYPLVLPIVGAAGAAALIRRDARVLAVGAVFGSIILFSLVLFLAGKSFGWLRFYIGVVPLGAMAAAYLISLANEPAVGVRRRRRLDIGSAVRSSADWLHSGIRARPATTERLAPIVGALSMHVTAALIAARIAAAAAGAALVARRRDAASRARRALATSLATPAGQRSLERVAAARRGMSVAALPARTIARRHADDARQRLATARERLAIGDQHLASARLGASAFRHTTAKATRVVASLAAQRGLPALSAAGALASAATGATVRGFLVVLTLALVAASLPSGMATVQAFDLAREEAAAIKGIGATMSADMPPERHQYRVARDVARYLDSLRLPDGAVVIDVALGFWVVLQSDRPRQFVITPDRDFEAVVADPATFGANYLLVSPASGVGSLSAISRAYPGIFKNGAGIGTLEREFLSPGGEQHTWRLYRVDD